jgi:hypothetical protein
MHGEAIYGIRLTSHYRPVIHELLRGHPRGLPSFFSWIDGWNLGMYDPQTKTLKTDPAEILQEAGIKVESYQSKPHRLEVLSDTLIAVGVALEYFDLV